MAEDPTAPSLNLTAEEKRVFGQLFSQADTEGLGVVTGEVAVKFFEKTRLEPRILGEIWQIADKENRGLLTPAGFGIVLRLIGHYQAGRDPTPELALRPGPLPKFDGGSAPGASPTIQPPPGPPPSTLQPQSSGSAPIRVPPLTPDKAAQYAALFEKSGAQNGQLPGDQAKQIFERAGLSNEVLVRIWTLADTEQRGALQVTEFVIAMHLLASFKVGTLRALPTVLPAGLYEAAARRPPSRQTSSNVPAIPRQFSGAAGAPRAGSPLSRPAFAPPQQYPQYPGSVGEWAITPSDKAKFDAIYTTLDKTNKGFITGEEAVPFFSESKLPEEALAQIWDLADINSAGRLSRDEFAVGMYLIRQQRGKRDGRDSLPATLPPNLVPPSMRNQVKPTAVPTAPTFDAPPSLPKSAAEDLFGLDALSSVPAPTQDPQSTGGSASLGLNDPFGNRTPITPSSPSHSTPQQSTIFKSFTPSSSFGQSLNYQTTGGSNGSGPSQSKGLLPQNSITEDLLGDNDPEISKRLTNETTEFGNLSNQVGTLTKKMQDVQGQRATSQNELNQASTQKLEFEQRLAQLRTLYEQEAQSVKSLEEKLTASRNETKKLQTEIAMIEGTYLDLQNQHQQVSTALRADQQENADLKERIRSLNGAIAQLKPALEKLRSDARQQKGLVAINKKQLATNENEREKLKAEAEELNKGIEEDAKILAAASKAQSPPPAANPSQAASPAPSTISANNPFFRRHGSSSEIPAAAYTSPAQQGGRSFENVFGPAFGDSAVAKEGPPPTSFKQEKEVLSSSSGSAASSHIQAGSGAELSPPSAASPAISNRELPQSTIPQPPPESRQTSSGFSFPEHEDSVTSSRQASAPNSRFGESSTGADTPTNYIGNTPTGSSTAGPVENPAPASPGLDRNSTASPAASFTKEPIPGAFPSETNSNVVATPTGGSTLSEQAAGDPFALNKELTRSGTAKDDFDAAFAGFGAPAKLQERSNTGSSAGGSAGGAPAGFHKEFPPIAELDNDDDSDSASDRGGFDDDFAPASPNHGRKPSSSQSPTLAKSTLSEVPNDTLQARPGTAHTAQVKNAGTAPPTPGAQISPPAYDKTVSTSDQAQSEAQQYSGLLPSREVPAPAAPSSTEPSSSAAAAAAPVAFGFPQVPSQPAAPTKVPFDDDFDEFDGLEDAKEGDADDDFANISVNDRSGLDDFNPMFDSPPQSKGGEHSTSGNSFGGDSVFAEFTQSPKSIHPPTTTTTTADSQDWDAIFAGLDTPSAAEATPANAANPTAKQNGNGAAPSPTAERPQPGRALTESGVHDDPLLKNLTGMGYARNDALAALEKYDYNLERAANYLASQS